MCACAPGFEERSGACADLDECAQGDACHPSASCRNTEGAFACDCPLGFTGGGTDGFACAPAIAVADDHVCAVNAEGRVLCWGQNDRGQLGDGSASQTSDSAVLVAGLDDVAMVDSGANYACALGRDGKVRCWGANDRRQLGVEGVNDRRTPVIVPGVEDAVLIATGSDACAVTRSGEMICWGADAAPARLAGVDGAVGLSISTFGTHLAHVRNGAIYGWGKSSGLDYGTSPTRLFAPATAVGVLASALVSCILNPAREVLCAGLGTALGVDSPPSATDKLVWPAGLSRPVVSLAATLYWRCVVRGSGEMMCWSVSGKPALYEGITSAAAVDGGVSRICALLNQGQSRCWAIETGEEVAAPAIRLW